MGERRKHLAARIGEGEHTAEVHLGQVIEERVVDRLAAALVGKRPARVLATARHADVGVGASVNPGVDLRKARLQLLLQLGKLVLNGLVEDSTAAGGEQVAVGLPLRITEQVVLEAAEMHALVLVTEDVAGLEAVTHALVGEELIAVGDEPLGLCGHLGVEIAFLAHGDPAAREGLGVARAQGVSGLQGVGDEADGIQQRGVRTGGAEFRRLHKRAEGWFPALVHRLDRRPLPAY